MSPVYILSCSACGEEKNFSIPPGVPAAESALFNGQKNEKKAIATATTKIATIIIPCFIIHSLYKFWIIFRFGFQLSRDYNISAFLKTENGNFFLQLSENSAITGGMIQSAVQNCGIPTMKHLFIDASAAEISPLRRNI